MPQKINSITGPAFGHQHTMIEVGCSTKSGKDADEDLVGQAINGWPAVIINLHILEVRDTE